jgi:hypothetical protein
MEIDFRKAGLNGQLSNLQRREFVFRSVPVLGMESILVAAKFSDITEQLHIATTLHGFEAMYYGKKQPWWEDQLLHWQGVAMEREGQDYADFVTEAYTEMFDQCEPARVALLATGDVKLKHSIGGTDPTQTVLTRNEFCEQLEAQRFRCRNTGILEF